MRVLLVSNGFQPNYEKAFANGLAANGVDVVLVSSNRTLIAELAHGVEAVNLRGSQDSHRVAWKKAANILRYAGALVRHIRVGRHDVVHLTGLYMTRSVFAGCLEWLVYRLSAKHFFMTVHNILPHGRHGAWYRVLHHVIYGFPHRLVVHTAKMQTELVEHFGIPENRIVVMPHGVDAVPENFVVPALSETLRILLFGGLVRYKGVDLLLSALAYCPELPIEITIAGEARDAAYAQEVEELIAALGANHKVTWKRGFIPESEVAGYFESCDAVALPYRHIDQSGVLFTAFRFGCPVIATDVGAFRDSLPEFAGRIVERSDPQGLADALREFYRHRRAFDRARIREHARSLGWQYCVRPLIAAYEEHGVGCHAKPQSIDE